MRIGPLDERVTLQRRVETQDEMGGQTWEWQDYCTVWAAAAVLSGDETFAGAQIQNRATARFRIRYRPGVREKMRLVQFVERDGCGPAKYFDIEAVLPVGRRVQLDLMCVERFADGFQD